MKRIKVWLSMVAIVAAVGTAFAFRTQQVSCVLYEWNPNNPGACDIPVYNMTTTTGVGVLTEGYARTPGPCEMLAVKPCDQ